MSARYPPNPRASVRLRCVMGWATQQDRPVLDPPVARRLRAVLHEIAPSLGVVLHAVTIQPDHVRVELAMDPTRCVTEVANGLKRRSAPILRREFPSLRTRLASLWTRRYYAWSVSQGPRHRQVPTRAPATYP